MYWMVREREAGRMLRRPPGQWTCEASNEDPSTVDDDCLPGDEG
jgi:hypothetical protein